MNPAISVKTTPRDRLGAVDALRGLALAGMFVVHVQYYADGPPAWAPRVEALVDRMFAERFWALFAFLFGVGFALQIERWGDKPGFKSVYIKRLLVLAGFAILITAFTGYRVLLNYAFWGLALLAMRRWSQRALLIAAVVIAFANPVVSALRWQVETRTIGLEASNEQVTRWQGRWRANHFQERELREHGTYPQRMSHRLRFELEAYTHPEPYVPGGDILMFVLGLFAVRRGLLRAPQEHQRLLLVVLVAGVILGQAADHLPSGWAQSLGGESLRRQFAWRGLERAVLSPTYQGLAYAAALLLWVARAGTPPRLCAWLSHAGRMSLTNYILQVCTLEILFTGMALSLTRPAGLAVALGAFAVQVLYSRWWFTRWRMGPVEWLWRSLAFGTRQPWRAPVPAR